MNIIFEVHGGIGKNIAATAVVQALRKQYQKDELIIVTTHPNVWKNNPNINYIYHTKNVSEVYFYFILNKECKIFTSEPYLHSDFITNKKHLIECWCDLFKIPYNNEKPSIYLEENEIKEAQKLYKSNKPILLIHTKGGDIYDDQYNWARDLPSHITEKVIKKYKNDYTIYNIKHPNQQNLKHTLPATENIRLIAGLILMSDKRLFIDSFAHHLAECLYKPSVVCWVSTSPKTLGYKRHINIKANPYEIYTPSMSYTGYDLIEDINNLPYSDVERIFDTEHILTKLK